MGDGVGNFCHVSYWVSFRFVQFDGVSFLLRLTLAKGLTLFLFDLMGLFTRYYMPGDDHGSYEDPFNTWAMLMNSKNLQWAFSTL